MAAAGTLPTVVAQSWYGLSRCAILHACMCHHLVASHDVSQALMGMITCVITCFESAHASQAVHSKPVLCCLQTPEALS